MNNNIIVRLWQCRFIYFVIAIGLFFITSSSYAEIKVQGNSKVLKDTIVLYSGLDKKSKEVNSNDIEEGIKSLYNTGFFSDVRIEKSDAHILIKVKENPTIKELAFENNKAIKSNSLKKEIRLTVGKFYSKAKVYQDALAIEKAYNKQGYYSAVVEPEIVEATPDEVKLIYNINEGDKATIKKVNFIGNYNYSSYELKQRILSREYAFYRFFSSADMYDPDKLLIDQEFLRKFYFSNGYFDFEIKNVTTELTPLRNGFIVTFFIDEGRQYKLNNFDIDINIKGVSTNEIRNKIILKKDKILDINDIESSEDAIVKYLGANGYAFADVSHDIIKDHESGKAIVKFIIEEGVKVYIGKININNNNRTMDQVIRRKLKIGEGDRYSETLLEKSKAAVTSLGYFSAVDFKRKRTAFPDKVDIDIDVKEISTGSMNFVAAYNDQTGISGSIGITENNFLGKGQSVDFNLEKSANSSQISFGFTESNFINTPVAAGFDFVAGNYYDKFAKYKNKNIGLGLRMQYELLEGIMHGIRYNVKALDIGHEKKDNISLVVQDFNDAVNEKNGGKATSSVIGHTISWANIDSFIFPTKGMKIDVSQDVAGLGGSFGYLKHSANAALFYPVYKKDLIFSFSARAASIHGIMGKKNKLINNLDLPQDYLRGFEPNGISPRHAKTGYPIGAKNYWSLSTELSFPVGLPEEVGIRGLAFYDMASMFGYDIKEGLVDDGQPNNFIYDSASARSSFGLGVVWRSPFGKIKLFYGIPLQRAKARNPGSGEYVEFDEIQRFTFSMGTMF